MLLNDYTSTPSKVNFLSSCDGTGVLVRHLLLTELAVPRFSQETASSAWPVGCRTDNTLIEGEAGLEDRWLARLGCKWVLRENSGVSTSDLSCCLPDRLMLGCGVVAREEITSEAWSMKSSPHLMQITTKHEAITTMRPSIVDKTIVMNSELLMDLFSLSSSVNSAIRALTQPRRSICLIISLSWWWSYTVQY